MFPFKKNKSEPKKINQIDPKEKVADALNTLYQSMVNDKNYEQNNTPEYINARKFIDTFYYELDEMVLEYLSAYSILNPEGKIRFEPSEEAFVDVRCRQGGSREHVQFEKNGRILSRKVGLSVEEPAQQEK